MHLAWSTPARYFRALLRQLRARRLSLPKFSGDFVPYADNDESYWSGFYATRPRLKQLSRTTAAAVAAAEWLWASAHAQGAAPACSARAGAAACAAERASLLRARRAVALVQHHDAITGTARIRVVADYVAQLRDATATAHALAAAAAARLLAIDPTGGGGGGGGDDDGGWKPPG